MAGKTKPKSGGVRRTKPRPAPTAGDGDGLAPDSGRGLGSLAQLLDNMGPSAAQVIVAPRGLDIPVGEPVIHDPLEQSPMERDAIVLAVGVRSDGSDARELLKLAG